VIHFREPSILLQEALEAPLQKPGPGLIGTGPFKVVAGSPANIESNRAYYLGPPNIRTIEFETYPNVRAAWADLLRDRIDMLYEVGPEAIDSIKGSNTASLFTFTRRYQHVIVFNPAVKRLSARVRQALSYAIDRPAIVNQALRTYGVPSSGPIWPKHWAVRNDLPRFELDSKRAMELLGSSKTPFHFTCLVAPESIDERIALEVKRQLAAIGVDMDVQGASREEILKRAADGQYEAAAVERVSGPTVFRPYLVWHSGAPFNFGGFGGSVIDAALDRVKQASDESMLRTAIVDMNKAFMDDPPALFLAWSVRARAVSKRFVVPAVEPGRDVLATLRMWRPAADNRYASRN
jgi:ABC-type transport system substrate-binding protein